MVLFIWPLAMPITAPRRCWCLPASQRTAKRPKTALVSVRRLPLARRRYLPANPSELSIFDKAWSFFIVNIAVHQGSRETLGISLSIAPIRSGFYLYLKISRQNQLGVGFFKIRSIAFKLWICFFIVSKHNWLRIRSTDYTLYFYVSLLATPQPEHRES